MWVADMDFETAPAIKESIMNRGAHGIYAAIFRTRQDYGFRMVRIFGVTELNFCG